MKKAASSLILAAALLMTPAATAQGLGTDWTAMPEKMSDLLNSGWTIVSHTNYETEMFERNDVVYSFVLTRNGKYAICSLYNPGVTNTNPKKGVVAASVCRALN